MGKLNENKYLDGQRTSRSLLAITLAASLAAAGCTTNQNLGNGTPTRSGPEIRRAPTSGVTTGGETGTPPPMTSSYTRSDAMALPAVTPRSITASNNTRNTIRRRTPDEAAAIMAGQQALRGRYLGVVSPGLAGRGYVSANVQTGQFQNPALVTNPQLTVNSSISSQPTAVISSGAGEGAGGIDAGAVFDGGTGAAAVIGGTDATPTGATIALPAGAFAATGTLPTAASANVPSVTAASVGTGRATVNATNAGATFGTTNGTLGLTNGGTLGATTVNGTATTANATANATTNATTTSGTTARTATTATTTRTGTTTAPVRVIRGTNGSVTVTNVNTSTTTTTTTSSGRNR